MRIERVVLETEHHRITGDLHLPREGYRSRLSDYLNRGDISSSRCRTPRSPR